MAALSADHRFWIGLRFPETRLECEPRQTARGFQVAPFAGQIGPAGQGANGAAVNEYGKPAAEHADACIISHRWWIGVVKAVALALRRADMVLGHSFEQRFQLTAG